MKTILKSSSAIVDADVLAKLNGLLKAANDTERPRNGYWAYASVEDPNGDSDGDIIDVAGIECSLSPSDQRYLPVLPGHQRKLASGHAAEIGRVEMVQRTKYKDMSAMAMYFTFALKEDGEPIDDMVKSYYERYKAGYCNAFSVGMEATCEPVKIKDKGFRYPKTKLYEVSMVSIGANQHAMGVSRSKEEDGEFAKLEKLIRDNAESVSLLMPEIIKVMKALAEVKDDVESIQEIIATTPKEIIKANPSQVDAFAAELAALNDRLNTRK